MKKIIAAFNIALMVLSCIFYLIVFCAAVWFLKTTLIKTKVIQVHGPLDPLYLTNIEFVPSYYNPVIRLETPKGQFYCSGYVISDIYAVTASHCLVDKSGNLSSNKISIYDANSENVNVTAMPVAINTDSDLGLIKGDFANFKKLRVLEPTLPINDLKGPFITCGFPYGDVLMCDQFVPTNNSFFLVQGIGFLYPGMSGGPVIDLNTKAVIGANSRVSGSTSMIAPLTGFFSSIGLKIIQ